MMTHKYKTRLGISFMTYLNYVEWNHDVNYCVYVYFMEIMTELTAAIKANSKTYPHSSLQF